jgi:glycosyltransferase involved in cell wall biosynthesis
MKIIIATDAWEPQINGVAVTLKKTRDILVSQGHEVIVIHPGLFKSFICPFTTDVQLAYNIKKGFLEELISGANAIHISTEGPIGLAIRRLCIKKKLPFTTAYHTNFPEYAKKNIGIPLGATKTYLRWFHNKAEATMTTTKSLVQHLKDEKIGKNIKLWSRGVDYSLFYPREKKFKSDKPIALYVGRISKEKNIESFLSIDMDITKVVVGGGPLLDKLQQDFPDCIFTGPLRGEELAQMYSDADIFVFPSKTDTFGLVVLEALASGVPVACYPVDGPGEIIGGNLDIGLAFWDLRKSMEHCLAIVNNRCIEYSRTFSWESCTEQFLKNLYLIEK